MGAAQGERSIAPKGGRIKRRVRNVGADANLVRYHDPPLRNSESLNMADATTMTTKGQVPVPREIRDRLGLKSGDKMASRCSVTAPSSCGRRRGAWRTWPAP